MNIITYNTQDKNFPEKLKEINDCPKKLYVLGELPDLNKKTAAIVGARQASNYGRTMAYEYAKILAEYDVQIISGMAKGIDAAAHEGALAAGKKTFAVLGSGVDVCYPACNKNLYDSIINNGGVISEYPPKSAPAAWHFPLRNRIISAFADLVLIIEAREKSGSLITADIALEQGKDVYALPGRVNDLLSVGCNKLIAQGAGIANEPKELIFALFHEDIDLEKSKNANVKISSIIGNLQQKNISGIATDEKKVYSCMRLQPKHVNEIVHETNLCLDKVTAALLSLELMGAVVEVTKNYFSIDNKG